MLASLLWTPICAAPARADSVSPEYRNPLPVQLVSYIDVHHFHAGSTFFVKVLDDWSGLGCSFRSGQILEGKIVLATPRRKHENPSQLAVSFDKTPCLYDKVTIDLVLAAAFFDASANTSTSSFPIMRSGVAQGSGSVAQKTYNIGALELASVGKGRERPNLKAGDVKGLKGITLRMGAGPGRSSILESTTSDVWLDKEAVLILVPPSVAFQRASAPNDEVNRSPASTPVAEPGEGHSVSNIATSIASKAPEPPAPPREFLPCNPPECTVDLPLTPSEGRASQSIAMQPLGYGPRPQMEIGELDNDDALAWLGDHQLMVAFNPHKLIQRDPAKAWSDTLRRIHAVVFDLNTRKVVSTADWSLSDRQPYLWQLSSNRVLVHVENELRILDEEMQVKARIPLDGPLAFVRVSPNGELMAFAVTHERHTPELHAKLREALASDPDEDVSIRILDKNFETVAQAASSRAIMPPILLNEGQVRMLAAPGAKYRLEMIPWRGEAKTIARFSSSCLPSVSSFAPDLLFVGTCSPQNREHEYRVLRPSGEVVLRGNSDLQNFGQTVIGTDHMFAVKVLHAGRTIVDGSAFRGDDLDYAEVRIFSRDGRNLKSIQIASPPPSRGAFALSSDGTQLAVLANSAVSLYPVP
ncbi:hypothetical protein [Occallatibacter savannae]|uniref:hypothetical protein n=1 Tax=Occallatibacter savannae TaxID=1002691 RepID=UPI000D68BF8A|nr:hypothetical protein [Occallatibacter savannae]